MTSTPRPKTRGAITANVTEMVINATTKASGPRSGRNLASSSRVEVRRFVALAGGDPWWCDIRNLRWGWERGGHQPRFGIELFPHRWGRWPLTPRDALPPRHDRHPTPQFVRHLGWWILAGRQ